MPQSILIALGGNALIKPGQKGSASQQISNIEAVASQIARLKNRGFRIVITHGNGPQVGNLLLQQEKARDYAPQMPLHVCVAQSQGMIGYFIQEALDNKLRSAGLKTPVVTIITQVLVDPEDHAFKNPDKQIGPYYQEGRFPSEWKMARTIKGFRRIVPSPKPKEIVEAAAIRKLSKDSIVIASGGGGIPVVREHGLKGVDAVIDKDLSAARLAEVVKADILAILTDVENVFLNYGKPNQKRLGKISLDAIKEFSSQNHFPPGTMNPKIQASIRFLQKGGKKVIITSFENLEKAVNGEAGTIITNSAKK